MDELSVIATLYEIHKKLLVLNKTIDRTYRFSLVEPTIALLRETLRELILAKHAPKTMKASYLIRADALAELAALHIRTILELKLANETNVLKLQAKLTEARKQIGGWRKSVQ